MTKFIWNCFVLCLCFLSLANCGLLKETTSDFTIRVSGTEGLKFSGHYSLVGTKALPEPVHAHAAIPGEYKGKGVMALCSFRKLTEMGSLKVEILKDGKVMSEAETRTPFGYVSLKTPMPEKNTIIAQIMGKVFGNE
jgi:hypothetical protein